MDVEAAEIVRRGEVRIRVRRSGMLQFQVFKVKRVEHGGVRFVELFLNRVLDMSEMQRVSNETHLPVEAENGRAFPEGKGAIDFATE